MVPGEERGSCRVTVGADAQMHAASSVDVALGSLVREPPEKYGALAAGDLPTPGAFLPLGLCSDSSFPLDILPSASPPPARPAPVLRFPRSSPDPPVPPLVVTSFILVCEPLPDAAGEKMDA